MPDARITVAMEEIQSIEISNARPCRTCGAVPGYPCRDVISGSEWPVGDYHVARWRVEPPIVPEAFCDELTDPFYKPPAADDTRPIRREAGRIDPVPWGVILAELGLPIFVVGMTIVLGLYAARYWFP